MLTNTILTSLDNKKLKETDLTKIKELVLHQARLANQQLDAIVCSAQKKLKTKKKLYQQDSKSNDARVLTLKHAYKNERLLW